MKERFPLNVGIDQTQCRMSRGLSNLPRKKNDLGIDITIATTTNSFTKPAILKAQAYGIVVQTSIKIDENFIKKLAQVHYYTVSFLKVKAIDLMFFDDSGLMIDKNSIKLSTTQEEKILLKNILMSRLCGLIL